MLGGIVSILMADWQKDCISKVTNSRLANNYVHELRFFFISYNNSMPLPTHTDTYLLVL